MPLEGTGGIGGEFMIIDDDNPHNGKGPKYAVVRLGSNGNMSVYDADPGFNSKDKVLQRLVDHYFELKNLEEFEQLEEYRKYEQIATNDYIIDD